MQTTEGNVEQIQLKSIQPDENQPRKDFNAARLSELMSSIKQHGIMSPLVVERMPGGAYQLVDGERRYRAATELKLESVPAIVIDALDETDRLIKQFHLQEQHQGWSHVEKAVAIGNLAENMKLSPEEVAKMLALPSRTIRDYIGFWSLLNRREYQKSEMPVSLASHIVRLRRATKKLYEETFEKEFSVEKQEQLEKAVIAQVKSGEIKNRNDFTKLYDVFTNDPDTITKFIEKNVSVTKIYLESNAKVAFHARNSVQLLNTLHHHLQKAEELGGLDMIRENRGAVNNAKRVKSLLNQIT